MDDDKNELRLGAAQVAEVFMDREATIAKDCEYIRRAGDQDVDLLVFPEFHVPTSPGLFRYATADFPEYYRQLFANAVTVPGPAVTRIQETAREAGVAVVLGITEKEPETAGTMYNSLVFVDNDGTLLGVRRKLVPTKFERLFHTGGSGRDVTTFESSLGTLGGLMCGEHTNHLAGYSLLAQGEAIHAAAWPAFAGYDKEYRENIVGIRTRFHALAGGVPAVAATGVLTDELLASLEAPAPTPGHGTSFVVDPMGRPLTDVKYSGEGIVHADVDMTDRTRSKAVHDVTGHYNRFDVFSLEVDRQPHEPIRFTGDGDGEGGPTMDDGQADVLDFDPDST